MLANPEGEIPFLHNFIVANNFVIFVQILDDATFFLELKIRRKIVYRRVFEVNQLSQAIRYYREKCSEGDMLSLKKQF